MKNHLSSAVALCAMLCGMVAACAPAWATPDSAPGVASFVQKGKGAVARPQSEKLNEQVSVKDFGATGDGVTDDQPAIQNAIDTGKSVFLPNGIYRLNNFLLMRSVAQRMFGESMHNVYLTSAPGSTHDLLRVAGTLSEVTGIHFRPGSKLNVCLRLYAASVHVHGNRFLAAANGAGTALVMTDQNPLGGKVAGAYTHVIENNHFGAAGFTFATDIADLSIGGITATKFLNNKHLSNAPIRIAKGGGNTYFGNLFQSASGTSRAKAGNGIDLGADVYGEMISGNYFELFAAAIVSRAGRANYQAFYSTGNHFDNTGKNHDVGKSSNYVADDSGALEEVKNGWSDSYLSKDMRVFNGASGGAAMLTLDEKNKAIKTNKRYSSFAALTFTADGQTLVPTTENMLIGGNAPQRTHCVLGTAGVQDGQRLTLLALASSVALANTGVRFAGGAASAVFGEKTGQVQAMELIFHAGSKSWYETSRTVR
jgi:hypothetical protein